MSVWLDNLDNNFVRCRKLGHQWDEQGWQSINGVAGLVLRCERCTMIRFDLYDSVGWLIGRRYNQPAGYKKPREELRPSGQDLAVALRNRAPKSQTKIRSSILEAMWARRQDRASGTLE